MELEEGAHRYCGCLIMIKKGREESSIIKLVRYYAGHHSNHGKIDRVQSHRYRSGDMGDLDMHTLFLYLLPFLPLLLSQFLSEEASQLFLFLSIFRQFFRLLPII